MTRRTKAMTPRCVVFDVDDTLFLESDYVRSGFDALDEWFVDTHQQQGFSDRAGKFFDSYFPGSFEDSVLCALETMGLVPEPDLLEDILHIYCSHRPSIELVPDAQRCINNLYGDFPMAVLTEGPVPVQHAKVEVLDLEKWCAPIVYANRWGPRDHGHHIRGFEEVEKRSGFTGQCVFVSHDPEATQTARKLGWSVARVRRPGSHFFTTDTPEGIPEFEDLTEFALWLVLN